MSKNENLPVIIIGTGLASLSAGIELEKFGHSCLFVERDSKIGGKVQTTFFEEKYYLDHGFQVLLPEYAELKTLLPKLDLELKTFHSGAALNSNGKIQKIADPFRHPQNFLSTAFGNYGTFKDKVLVLKLQAKVALSDPNKLLEAETGTSLEFLQNFGFSQMMIENFWKPFFSGIFLEQELKTRSGFMLFLYKMFAAQPVAVPKKGIGELTQQMKNLLTKSEFILNAEVIHSDEISVTTADHKKIEGKKVISFASDVKLWGSVCTLHFVAPESPIDGPWLFLNSKRNNNLVNHIAVMTEVSKEYSITDESLISVNIIKNKISNEDFNQVMEELEVIFGKAVKRWRFLRSYEIQQALPLCLTRGSNFLDTPSQQGALLRGKNRAHSLIF